MGQSDDRRFTELSRRSLLKAAVGAAAATPALGGFARWQQPRPTGSFDFAFFSDSHVGLKSNVAECRDMLVELQQAFKPAFGVNGGDIVDYGWPGEYDNYAKITADLPFKLRAIPGNHDVRWAPRGLAIFEERLGEPYSCFDHLGTRHILLDSSVPLSHWGHYESAMLRWLEERLSEVGRETPVFVYTHHWVGRDAVMVDNEEALRKVLEPYNVKLLLNGHGHSDLLWQWDGITCTMNKGLYQGSYERIEVDRDRNEVRLSRRSGKSKQLKLLATVPLKASRSKRPLWAIAEPELVRGRRILDAPADVAEYRWDASTWLPIADGVRTADLNPGVHQLAIRSAVGGQTSQVVKVTQLDGSLKEVWSKRLTGGVMSHVMLVGDDLLVSTMDGTVSRLRAADGTGKWSAKTGGYCHSTPVTDGSVVIVGSADQSVHGFDFATGMSKWTFKTAGPVYASAAFAQGIAAIGSGDGKIYGLDPATGVQVWFYELPRTNSSFVQSMAATDGERFYFGAWDNYLYCLDAKSGKMLWRRICCERTFAYSPAIGAPAVSDGRVIVPANGNVLYAFATASGDPLWEYSSPGDKVGYSGGRIQGDAMVIGCLGDLGQFRCIGTQDGKERWCIDSGSVIYDSSPAVDGDFAAVGSVDGTLNVASISRGALVGQYRMPVGHFLASPAMRGRRIWAATYSDVLSCIEIVT